MKTMSPSKSISRYSASIAAMLVLAATIVAQSIVAQSKPQSAAAHELIIQFDAAQTVAEITLPATKHTVHGTFAFKRGSVHYDPASGKATGEIVFDATSGKTGNDSRDNKMHKEVLESARYPEITFRPDRAEGPLAPSGRSSLKVHGMFAIHGAEHELTVPVDLTLNGGSWSATARFEVPYVQWGMKDPSSMFLHVNKTVQVEVKAAGSVGR
jgi:polyisoprenoid-binding protein YceI